MADLAALAILHLLQPGADVLTDATSSYVHGTGGFLAQVGAVATGVGALALAGESTAAGDVHNIAGNVAFFALAVAAPLVGGAVALQRAGRQASSSSF